MTKVPRGEDPSAESAQEGRGKLEGTTVGRKEGEASVRSWELAGVT